MLDALELGPWSLKLPWLARKSPWTRRLATGSKRTLKGGHLPLQDCLYYARDISRDEEGTSYGYIGGEEEKLYI